MRPSTLLLSLVFLSALFWVWLTVGVSMIRSDAHDNSVLLEGHR